jgi:C1A family cysteine protease
MRQKYMEYVAEHGKFYITAAEFEARSALFATADELIESHNSTNASYTLGHNFFSDMTVEERSKMLGRLPETQMRKFAKAPVMLDDTALPDSIDWRELGAVNPIRDQGQCGSCWAFSSVCSMEGAHAVATGDLLQFSEQQLVDCAFLDYGNLGCKGGLEENAFTYYETHGAIARDSYSYTASRGACQYDSLAHTAVEVSTYTDVTPNLEGQTKAAIAQQPISVAIQANQLVFQLYSGGVFDDSRCGDNLDHAVALVGYGTENGQAYYILRNSWGTTWGEQGYMKIADLGDGVGICGVQSAPTYPSTN